MIDVLRLCTYYEKNAYNYTICVIEINEAMTFLFDSFILYRDNTVCCKKTVIV